MLDLATYLGKTISCDCGRVHRVDTLEVSMDRGALESLPDVVGRAMPLARTILLVADSTTMDVAGRRAEELLTGDGRQVHLHLLEEHGGHSPVADAGEVARAVRHIEDSGVDGVVAVGSGTVNDVAKLASFQSNLRYITVPTAASMNGYTSAIAAILGDGVKRTIPCQSPIAVVADLDVVAAAPVELNRAGLGDLLSKPVSGTDWLLAHMLKGEHYCTLPGRMVESAEAACLGKAEAIGKGDPEAAGVLLEALLLSGLSMAVAGSSSPASGGEHLISHLLDMRAHVAGRAVNLHGAQVGVGTLITATLYRHLLRLSADDVARAAEASMASRGEWQDEEERIRRHHGVLADKVLPEARSKWLQRDAFEAHVQGLANRWDSLVGRLSPGLRAPETIREALAAAGAPVGARGLDLEPDDLRSAFLLARDVRSRYTVLDLTSDLGILEQSAGDVLDEAGVLES